MAAWSDREVREILKEIDALEVEWSSDGDVVWRAMSIALELRRFVRGIAMLIGSAAEEVTLSTLSDYTQLVVEQGRRADFEAWDFDIHRTPALLAELARQPSAGLLDRRLADHQYHTVVVLLAYKIITAERVMTPS
jgi:hypothetical protein